MSWDNEKTNKRFTHIVEEDFDEYSDFWDSDADQQLIFDNAFSHIKLDCEVDLETGEARCWGINGTALVDPVRI